MRELQAGVRHSFSQPGLRQTRVDAIRNGLSANPDRAAGGAEVAAILLDQGVVAAFAATSALHRRRRAALRRLHDSHLLYWHTVFVENAKHNVTVNHQCCDVGNG